MYILTCSNTPEEFTVCMIGELCLVAYMCMYMYML